MLSNSFSINSPAVTTKAKTNNTQRSARHFHQSDMDTSESTENQRNYHGSTHVEIRGGEFHGAMTIASSG